MSDEKVIVLICASTTIARADPVKEGVGGGGGGDGGVGGSPTVPPTSYL